MNVRHQRNKQTQHQQQQWQLGMVGEGWRQWPHGVPQPDTPAAVRPASQPSASVLLLPLYTHVCYGDGWYPCCRRQQRQATLPASIPASPPARLYLDVCFKIGYSKLSIVGKCCPSEMQLPSLPCKFQPGSHSHVTRGELDLKGDEAKSMMGLDLTSPERQW